MSLTVPLAPFINKFDLEYKQQTVNGSLFNTPHSIFREEPSEEVDAAWDAISEIKLFAITAEDITRLGKDPSKAAKAPESWGFGPDAYIGQLDGSHTLHCLNAVRKFAYFDHYHRPRYNSFADVTTIEKIHLSHCLHIVLQSLMCQPSMGVVTYEWLETQMHPFPDFNIERKCVNYHAIQDWQRENSITDTETWERISGPPEGAYVKPASPEMLAWQEEVAHEESS
jgi:Mycotoxin biosynthesis protein UstYa